MFYCCDPERRRPNGSVRISPGQFDLEDLYFAVNCDRCSKCGFLFSCDEVIQDEFLIKSLYRLGNIGAVYDYLKNKYNCVDILL